MTEGTIYLPLGQGPIPPRDDEPLYNDTLDLHNFEQWVQSQSPTTLAKFLAIVNKEILERSHASADR